MRRSVSLPPIVLLLIPIVLVTARAAAGQEACASVQACRAAAEGAAARQDYEAFHDLAWRAMQRGRPNDPDLMYLLARAQSLSGRPGDALVMLRRLAQMGIATDAATNDEFRRVRSLPGWPELETAIASLPARGSVSADPPAGAAAPAARKPERVAPPPAPPTAGTPAPAVPPTPRREAPAVPARDAAEPRGTSSPPAGPRSEEALRLTSTLTDPIGLAHDGVSRRFIVGDRRLNKLVVVDEVFNRVTDMVAASSAGFFGLRDFEIDRARGDLWVANSSAGAGASLHKLQLVSGRVLYSVPVPADAGPVDFVDISIAPGGAVLALDAAGGRVFRLRPGSRTFDPPAATGMTAAGALAAIDDDVVVVAHRSGLARIRLSAADVSRVHAGRGIDLAGISRLWWFDGGLVALQAAGGTVQVVRLRMDGSHGTVERTQVLDTDIGIVNETVAAPGRDALYYVSGREGANVVRRLRLR